MNITKNQIDDLTLCLTIGLTAADYAAGVQKRLKDRRRTAEFKGFRRGMAPMGLIQRVYGEEALVQEVNRLVSEQLDSYIRDHQLRVIGEPLASEDQPETEWKDGNDFTFKFDIATSPELDFTVDAEDRIPYYEITVTAEAKAAMKQEWLRQYGEFQEGETVQEDGYFIADLDNGEHKAEGVSISLRSVAESLRPGFAGAKVGDKLHVNVNEAFENETDRASLLKVKKEQLAGLNPEFELTVVNIKTFVPAEENEATYSRIFGEGQVKTPEEFEAKIEERLKANYRQEADYRFSKDAREYFLKKADVKLPEPFLKRWLYEANEGKLSREEIDKEFDGFLADFRWQLVRGAILKKFDLKVTQEDLHEAAESYAAYQYAMYGMRNVPHEMIHDMAHRLLEDKAEVRRLEEQVEDNKAIAAIREHVTLQSRQISEEEFKALQ